MGGQLRLEEWTIFAREFSLVFFWFVFASLLYLFRVFVIRLSHSWESNHIYTHGPFLFSIFLLFCLCLNTIVRSLLLSFGLCINPSGPVPPLHLCARNTHSRERRVRYASHWMDRRRGIPRRGGYDHVGRIALHRNDNDFEWVRNPYVVQEWRTEYPKGIREREGRSFPRIPRNRHYGMQRCRSQGIERIAVQEDC